MRDWDDPVESLATTFARKAASLDEDTILNYMYGDFRRFLERLEDMRQESDQIIKKMHHLAQQYSESYTQSPDEDTLYHLLVDIWLIESAKVTDG